MEDLIVMKAKDLKNLVEECCRKVLSELKSQSSEPDILTIHEAAAFLKISKHTIYSYTRNRVIPFSKSGRHLRFSRTVLEQWLKENLFKTRNEILSGN